jgi:hypothetical protein
LSGAIAAVAKPLKDGPEVRQEEDVHTSVGRQRLFEAEIAGPGPKVSFFQQLERGLIPSKHVGTAGKVQALGGTYTVMTDRGQLVRIAGKDADAIGQESPATSQTDTSPAAGGPDVEKLAWAQLRSTFDPEIPVNIVDLGLVYLCRVTPLPQGGNKVEVKFTLTAPGCGMGGVLKGEQGHWNFTDMSSVGTG